MLFLYYIINTLIAIYFLIFIKYILYYIKKLINNNRKIHLLLFINYSVYNI